MTTAPPTRAVANLHLHLEYDSGLEVIAAAMATVTDGFEDAESHRADIAEDVSAAVSHLLHVEELISEGSPLRIVDASVEVSVDIPESHEVPTDPLDFLRRFNTLEDQAATLPQAAYEMMLLAPRCAGVESAFPVGVNTRSEAEGLFFTMQWAIALGYLWQASIVIMDELFADVQHLTASPGPEAWRETNVISQLPERYAHQYDAVLARRLLVTMAGVTAQIASEWDGGTTLAQDIAMWLALRRAAELTAAGEVVFNFDFFGHMKTELVNPKSLEYVEYVDDGVEDGFEPMLLPFGTQIWFDTEDDLGAPVPPYAQD